MNQLLKVLLNISTKERDQARVVTSAGRVSARTTANLTVAIRRSIVETPTIWGCTFF